MNLFRLRKGLLQTRKELLRECDRKGKESHSKITYKTSHIKGLKNNLKILPFLVDFVRDIIYNKFNLSPIQGGRETE
jgi:hypothetical protein